MAAAITLAAGASAAAEAPVLEEIAFADLAGWSADDHLAAFTTFLASCRAVAGGQAADRPAALPPPELAAVCERALAAADAVRAPAGARAFFEANFRPHRVATPGGEGFLTAYYEPEIAASHAPTAAHSAAILARPPDLVTLAQGESAAGLDPALQAARMGAKGLEPYADRAAIEDGALDHLDLAIAYVDPVDAFVVHIQGSARLRFEDGTVLRIAYAGRNGWPFTAVGRLLVERGELALDEASMDTITAWIRARGDAGRALMRENRSYIFFRKAEELDPAKGPRGGEGVQLTPGRSIAVDRRLWPYGLPFFIEADLPLGPEGAAQRWRRLMVAQDTGSAILGPARADLFLGSGPAAGTLAGRIRHAGRLVVLMPRAAAAEAP